MSTSPFIVQVCDFPANGQGYYRYHEPSRHLARLGVTVVDCDPFHRHLRSMVELADVLVLQVYDWDWLPIIKRRAARGQATVVEASDYYFDVQPWNPGSQAWADAEEQECLKCMLAAADAVQTTTPELAHVWRRWAPRVEVFPNQLMELTPLPERSQPLTIGWGGSGSHLADWYAFAPVLQPWLDAHPEVHLSVMTDEIARNFIRPSHRYHFRGVGSLGEYLAFVRRLDIGLAPLLPTEFNVCRSDLKYLEYAAHGVAGIYSDLEPFRGSVRDGENGLLFRTASEFYHCLDRLTSDQAFRQGLVQRAYEAVANRLLDNHVGSRLRFYRELCDGCGRVPVEVLCGAVRDGDYYQLRQGHPERILTASKWRADESALLRIVEEDPTYDAALRQLGYVLNDAGRYAEALVYLDRALGINPDSCRSLCEIARSLAGVGESAAARECLERALVLCPRYPPAQKSLLAMLPADEARRWRIAEYAGRYSAWPASNQKTQPPGG